MNYSRERELKQRYDEFLNEIYGDINICGIEYPASQALKSVDEIAYDCGFNDWLSAERIDIDADEEE
jgi:AraC-like DNA-binding protein